MPELSVEIVVAVVVALLIIVGGVAAFVRSRARLPDPIEEQTPQLPQRPAGLSERFFTGLARSREALAGSLARAFGGPQVDETALQELEDALIAADVGVRAATELCQSLRDQAKKGATPPQLREQLRRDVRQRLGDYAPLAARAGGPLAILVVGVNGSGKTTTIGKLATRYKEQGKSVLLAAGDTFRAGAIEQLKVWGERAGVPVIAQQEGSDPAAVIFDALQAGLARKVDVVICDTAGRLQAQKALMDELGKVVRVMRKAIPDAPHEVLLVLDATIGQNALSQARIFKDVVGVTGVALTKLDGTAKGGVVVAVRQEMGIPVKLVGLGEKPGDLRDFDPDAFVDALIAAEQPAPV